MSPNVVRNPGRGRGMFSDRLKRNGEEINKVREDSSSGDHEHMRKDGGDASRSFFTRRLKSDRGSGLKSEDSSRVGEVVASLASSEAAPDPASRSNSMNTPVA